MSGFNLSSIQKHVSSRWIFLALLIVVIALVTRYPGLWPSLWGDELKAVSDAQGTLGDPLRFQRDQGGHGPLYYTLLNIWMRLGTGDAWIRSLSLLFGLCTIPVIGLIAKELGGKTAGWMGALLAAVTHPLCWTSYEARNYALHILLGALAWLFLTRALKRETKIDWVLFAMCLAGTWYSFYYGFYVAIGLGVFFLAMRPNKRQFIFFTLAAIGAIILFLPWILVVLEQMGRRDFSSRAVSPSWSVLGLVRLSGRAIALHGPWNPFGTTTESFLGLPTTETVLLLLLVVAGLFAFRRWPFLSSIDIDPWLKRGLWATALAVLCYLLSSHYTALADGYVRLRYLSFMGVFLSVLTALALMYMKPRTRIVVVVMLVLAGTIGEGYRVIHRTSQEWRKAVALIESEVSEGDHVVANFIGVLAYRHYGSRIPAERVVRYTQGNEDIAESFSDETRVWVLSNKQWGASEDTYLKIVGSKIIKSGYQPVDEWTFYPDITVRVYESR